MRKLKSAMCVGMLGAALCSMSAAAQQPIFYPAKGQSAQQQGKDTGECKAWAQQTTGINPNAPPPAPPPPPGPAVGGGERAKGAAAGAIIGGATGGSAGGGAAAGMVVGGMAARKKQGQQQQAAAQQAGAAQASQVSTYNRAVGACMEGKGYTVK